MTTPLIPPTPARVLPVSLGGDLVVDFRNRTPPATPGDPPGPYIDYPDGVTAVFTIYTDLKSPGADRITVAVTPSGSHCVVKVDGVEVDLLVNNTLWLFRLVYPDGDLIDGHDRPIVNGVIMRYDGKAAAQ